MNFDLIIRGGTVVDGGNTPANIADVAVLGDTIVEIGNVSGTATREIDASGLDSLICTPTWMRKSAGTRT